MSGIAQKVHRLKTWPEFFQEVADGNKTAELRKNDRDFNEGDWLILEEYDPDADRYSGRREMAQITHIVWEGFGLQEGYVMISFSRPN